MKNSWKGAFFSGLVFPGLGQILLRKYKRGIAFILAVIVSLVVIIANATQQAMSILEQTNLQGGNVDINAVSDAADKAVHTSSSLIIQFGLIVILLCWIMGTIDAYRIGRKKDLEEGGGINKTATTVSKK